MQLPSIMQGRPFGPSQLAEIRELLARHPQASRYELSRRLATLWDWRSANGQLKDMAARTLLLKLHEQGWVVLPRRRMASPTRSGRPPRSDGWVMEMEPLAGSFQSLGPVLIQEVSQPGWQEQRRRLEACLERHHYLGYRSRVGQNLQYWIHSSQGRPLACVVFGAAAWQCAARDHWVGWTGAQRAQGLAGILNNTRFLVLPWIRVPHLASHILGRISRRVAADWQAKYRQPLHLLETFVDRDRFEGTCYQAANWLRLGVTRGRGRQGTHTLSTTVKEVYVYPLHRRFRQHLLTTPDVPSIHEPSTSPSDLWSFNPLSNPIHSGSHGRPGPVG